MSAERESLLRAEGNMPEICVCRHRIDTANCGAWDCINRPIQGFHAEAVEAAATLDDLTIPSKVVVNDETYLPEWRIIASLACVYNHGPVSADVIATLCDEYLDTSGAMLGRVRQQAVSDREAANA